jgi:hypothetical protein
MSSAKLGKTMANDFKIQRREIMKERWKDPEFIKQMSEDHSGSKNGNYGKTMSDDQKAKLSFAGSNRSDEWKSKQSEVHIGTKDTEETKFKKSISHRGEKCYNWRGGITDLNLHIRNLKETKDILVKLLKEKDYTDIFTNVRGGLLVCHHVIPQNIIIALYKITTIDEARNCPLLFDKHNLIVMLSSAHDKFHNLYGDDKNIFELSKEQISELYDGVEINPSANPRWANH